MKDWYQNRMEQGVSHRGFGVPEGKHVYLTPEQAKLHNKNDKEQRVAKVDNLPKKEEVAVLADWDEYQKSLEIDTSKGEKVKTAPQPEEKSQSKANRRNKQ